MPRDTYNVFLVDDSEDDRFFVRRILQKTRFTIIGEARDGSEAVEYLSKIHKSPGEGKGKPPDLLMLDLKMPGMTGYDLLEWLKSHPLPEMMVVVLSGSFLPEDIIRCHALGAHAYYKKTTIKDEQAQMLSQLEEILSQRN